MPLNPPSEVVVFNGFEVWDDINWWDVITKIIQPKNLKQLVGSYKNLNDSSIFEKIERENPRNNFDAQKAPLN